MLGLVVLSYYANLASSDAFIGSLLPYFTKNANCIADSFECTNGECIRKDQRCDGRNDCKDLSDERDCGENSVTILIKK